MTRSGISHGDRLTRAIAISIAKIRMKTSAMRNILMFSQIASQMSGSASLASGQLKKSAFTLGQPGEPVTTSAGGHEDDDGHHRRDQGRPRAQPAPYPLAVELVLAR